MKESRHNSGTSLFLMEMILALLFLSEKGWYRNYVLTEPMNSSSPCFRGVSKRTPT